MEKYIEQLIGLSNLFTKTKSEYDSSDLYEGLPIRMFLGNAGQDFVENFSSLSDNEISAILLHIEDGMLSKDEDISNSVAVYFLDAMVNKSNFYVENWEKIRSMLNKESLEYVKAYNALWGIVEV